MQHPPNSSNFALCGFFFFQNWWLISLVGFEYVEDIKRNTINQFHALSKEEIQRFFDQWKAQWNKSWGLFSRIFSFQSVFISVLVNTASVSIIFKTYLIYTGTNKVYIIFPIHTHTHTHAHTHTYIYIYIYIYIHWWMHRQDSICYQAQLTLCA